MSHRLLFGKQDLHQLGWSIPFLTTDLESMMPFINDLKQCVYRGHLGMCVIQS